MVQFVFGAHAISISTKEKLVQGADARSSSASSASSESSAIITLANEKQSTQSVNRYHASRPFCLSVPIASSPLFRILQFCQHRPFTTVLSFLLVLKPRPDRYCPVVDLKCIVPRRLILSLLEAVRPSTLHISRHPAVCIVVFLPLVSCVQFLVSLCSGRRHATLPIIYRLVSFVLRLHDAKTGEGGSVGVTKEEEEKDENEEIR